MCRIFKVQKIPIFCWNFVFLNFLLKMTTSKTNYSKVWTQSGLFLPNDDHFCSKIAHFVLKIDHMWPESLHNKNFSVFWKCTNAPFWPRMCWNDESSAEKSPDHPVQHLHQSCHPPTNQTMHTHYQGNFLFTFFFKFLKFFILKIGWDGQKKFFTNILSKLFMAYSKMILNKNPNVRFLKNVFGVPLNTT